MRTNSIKTLILVLMLCAFGGCSDKFTAAELVGSYRLNVGPGVDILDLKSDGTYVHSYQDGKTLRTERAGKWQLDTTGNGRVVSLENFKVLPGENETVRGFYLLKPMRFFGSIRLMRNLDLNEFYKRE